MQSLLQLSGTLFQRFQYVPGVTSVLSPIEQILETGQGVCQDYAHVMIAIARGWHIPARYVSGYLYLDGSGESRQSGQSCLGGVPIAQLRLDWL